MTDIVFAFQLVIDCMIRPYRRNILLSLCLLLPSTTLPLCPGFGLSSYKTILPTHQPTLTSPPKMEGEDIRVSTKFWGDIASIECRINLMRELSKINVGFGDLENFNLGLI